jgi:glycosyltransferase involved in cell wall biosynthesis
MGNPEPLVSIVMAVHDEEMYLVQCIDSILAQTYTNWELIAVNDHSKDMTPQILKDYARKDPRIRVFNCKRRKLIPALQEAYRHCSGSLINRMDADDYMPEYKLKVLVEEWNQHGKGTIIAGGTSHFIEKGEVGEGFQRYDRWLNSVARRNAHYNEIYQECVIPSHCWIIHKEDFDAVGAFDPEVYPEDYDLCFRFYRKGLKVVGLDKVLHYWRDHPVRISRTWDCYTDNRYFDLKLRYFYEIDRDKNRPLVLWGAGRNGKDLAKLLLEKENSPDPEPASVGGKSPSDGDSTTRHGRESEQGLPVSGRSVGSPSKYEILLPLQRDRIMDQPYSDPGGRLDRRSDKSSSGSGNSSPEPQGIRKWETFHWVCDNRKKIGKEIYGVRLKHFGIVPDLHSPQILIVVNSPGERNNIRKKLKVWNKKPVKDFWFFT